MRHVTKRLGKGVGVVRMLVVGVTLLALLASLVGVFATSRPAEAADFSEAAEFKLTASDGAAGDMFGRSVAVDGDTAIVGVPYADLGGGSSDDYGSAYVYVREGTGWIPQQKLQSSDASTDDSFGDSVAMSGDTVVIGAPADDVGANADQGSAYVFVRSGTSWSQQQKLTASDGAASDWFGGSVAIDGDTVVVGAPTDDVGVNADEGSAHVFGRSGTAWSLQAKLTPFDGAASDWFGGSVAISGDTVVVGAFADDVGVNADQGSAFVFVRSGIFWVGEDQLTAFDGAASDWFGKSVAIDGDTVVVGAPADDVGVNADQGSAYVFVRSGTSWSEYVQGFASDGAADDRFGVSVAIAGDNAVVGAFTDDVEANGDQGSAYVYEAAGGGGAAQVAATVTLESISISITIPEGYPTAVDYGTMPTNAEAVPVSYTPGTNQYLRVQNNGNVEEDVFIKGGDATCGAGTWTLAATPGADQYSHLYGMTSTPVSYSPLSKLASVLGTLAVDWMVDFNLKIQTPTSSTVYGQYSTTVTVLAVAH